MSLEKWKYIFDAGVVIALLLSFIFGAGALWTARRLNRIQAEQLVTKDRQLAADLKAKDLEIGRAVEKASAADAQAGDANKEAAKANERTAKLELDAVTQRERAAIAERALLELQQRIRPRSLSKQQRAVLKQRLARESKGAVEIQFVGGNDPEPGIFAAEIADVLKDCGWSVKFNPNIFIGFGGPTGLVIKIKRQTLPENIFALAEALKDLGFPTTAELDTALGENQLTLIVGVRN